MLEFLTISCIIFLGAVSPGPDFILVTRNALQYSQRTGVMTALGVACGAFLHASYCILGLAVIISKSLILFKIIKYIGAGYLIYLGAKGILSKESPVKMSVEKAIEEIRASHAFFQGLLCCALNPKAVLFFLALFTMVIKPSTSFSMQFGYALDIVFLEFFWFACVSKLFAHEKVKNFLGRFLHYMSKFFSVVLVSFGLKIALF